MYPRIFGGSAGGTEIDMIDVNMPTDAMVVAGGSGDDNLIGVPASWLPVIFLQKITSGDISWAKTISNDNG